MIDVREPTGTGADTIAAAELEYKDEEAIHRRIRDRISESKSLSRECHPSALKEFYAVYHALGKDSGGDSWAARLGKLDGKGGGRGGTERGPQKNKNIDVLGWES